MEERDQASGDALPQISEADIVSRLDEAEADEAAGRFTDGVAFVRDLRRRAHELQANTKRSRA